MSGSEIAPDVGGPDGAADEDARQFILKAKHMVERCLAQGMNKAQMFRVIREEGLHPAVVFAVYRELRHQNRGFFQEYYCTIDLREQRKRLDHLLRAYRTATGGRDAEDDGVRVPETVTPVMSMEETSVPPVNMEWPDQQALQAWLLRDGSNHQLAPASWTHHQVVDLPAGEQVPNNGQLVANGVPAGVAWPRQVSDLPEWEGLHNHHEQPLADGTFQWAAWPQQQEMKLQVGQMLQDHQQPSQGLTGGQQVELLPVANLHYHEQAANSLPPLTPAAGLQNDAMMDSWPLSHGDQSFWQA